MDGVKEKFWNNVAIGGTGCWNWTAGTRSGRKQGYGGFIFNGEKMLAHRVSWILTIGEIPKGMLICHHCDNPSCVNPNHLFQTTHSGNTRDAVRKGRQVMPDNRAEGNPSAKLNWERVGEIRESYAKGDATQRELGVLYGVRRSNIGFIVRNKSWRE